MVHAVTFLAAIVATMPAGRAIGQQTVATGADDNRGRTAAEELLSRIVTIDVHEASLRRAIDLASQSAGVPIQYQTEVVDAYSQTVTLRATRQPLRVVLERMLSGTTLQVIADGSRRLAIVRDAAAKQGERIITGHVLDAKTQRPLVNVVVTLDDRAQVVRTDASGRYRFTNVPAGAHTVRVRGVGFLQQAKSVTVNEEATPSLDFALEKSAINTLDQVVVTATGAQRVKELGHVVAQVNADSLVKAAPITNLMDLLTTRVPGLQVYSGNGGIAGGDAALRLRGQTTVWLDPQPIVIVDGVRYRSSNTIVRSDGQMAEDSRPFGATERSPLNDLNVNDIETVEVVKGPSASTLYGPDAANGVIVITTKRGRPGRAQWNAYARASSTTVPTQGIGRTYVAWGHNASGQTVPWSCTLIDQYYYDDCTQDSIRVAPNNITNADLTVLQSQRPQWQYGANVGGGRDDLRYYFSAGADRQIGAMHISPVMLKTLKEMLGVSTVNDALQNPNRQQQITLQSNVSANVSPTATVSVTSSYTDGTQRNLNMGAFNFVLTQQAPLGTPEDSLGKYFAPNAFLASTEMEYRHLTATISGNWQAVPWLSLHADVGLDGAANQDRGVIPYAALGQGYGGEAHDFRRDDLYRNASLGATINAGHRGVDFRTSLGLQYGYGRQDGLNASGSNLAPGSQSISTAANLSTSQLWSETVTLGSYAEEVVGLDQRLFLTGSLRVDGATSYGDKYHPQAYPKVGLSWILSDEPVFQRIPGLDELRARYSYGAASKAPTSAMKLGSIAAGQVTIEGGTAATFQRMSLVNATLRPERSQEYEYGVDGTFASGFIHAELTWWHRRTLDQLHQVNFPTGLPSTWGNIGEVTARGTELSGSARLINRDLAQFTLGCSYAFNTDKLVRLGDALSYATPNGGFVEGYPLSASFGYPIIGVADTVGTPHDGIILPSEVIRDTALRFLGLLYPPRVYTLTPSLSLLQGRFRISASLDRSAGFKQIDPIAYGCKYGSGLCLAPLLVSTPPLVQAKYAGGQVEDFLAPGDFVRFREFSISADLSSRLTRALHVSHGTVDLQVRNLGLWTKYKGLDPESAANIGTTGTESFRYDVAGTPQARAWTLRVDITP